MTAEVWAAIGIPAAGFVGAWVRSVESRLAAAEEVCKKVDELVTILLEDRLAQSQDRSHA